MTEKIQFSAARAGWEQAKSYLEYKILEMIQRTDVVVTNNSLRWKQIEDSELYPIRRQLCTEGINPKHWQSVESSTKHKGLKSIFPTNCRCYLTVTISFRGQKRTGRSGIRKKECRRYIFAPGIYLEKKNRTNMLPLVRDIPKENNYRAQPCAAYGYRNRGTGKHSAKRHAHRAGGYLSCEPGRIL